MTRSGSRPQWQVPLPQAAGTWPSVLLLDLDGVVYTDELAMPGAVETVAAAHRAGVPVRYVTNNAFRTQQQVAARLNRIGVPAAPGEVVTSSGVAAALLAARRENGSLAAGPIAVVGGPGLTGPLRDRGFTPVPAADAVSGASAVGDPARPAALVQGFTPDLAWSDLAGAAHLVRAGVWWLATNLDVTLPTEGGPAPGNGAFVTAVATAAGRRPDAVAGKPEAAMFDRAAADAGVEDIAGAVVVGDRLDTDIAGAVAAGCPSLLVLTGVHGIADAVAAPVAQRPSRLGLTIAYVAADHPAVGVDLPGLATCQGAVARILRSGAELECTVTDGAGRLAWDRHTGLLAAARALLGAAWSLIDAAPTVDSDRLAAELASHPVVRAIDDAARRLATR